MSKTTPVQTEGPFAVGAFKGRDVLSIKQFNRAQMEHIFATATNMRTMVDVAGGSDLCKGRVLANIFFEPSTRTASSFHTAMLRLGGTVLSITDIKNSSVSKGETLEDTMRCLECYADVVVMRHPEIGSAARAAAVMEQPLLNAGDGAGEHPTQALLDAFTIINELGHLDGLTVTMLGDLKHGRTVHSLARLLSRFNVTLNYVSPDFLRMPEKVTSEVKANGAKQSEHADLTEVLASTDILYVTRVQKERFEDPAEYAKAAGAYTITPELLTELKAKDTMRILHPLPRVGEIDPRCDADPRAAYFRQMKCGLYVRMALLALALGKC